MASLAETLFRVTKVGIAMVFVASQWTRSAFRRLGGYPITSDLLVLMYHSVKRQERERFARQMDQLVRVASPVFADFNESKITNGRDHVAVTFDDGYQSVLENAIPILRDRDIPATIFVPTKDLGNRPAWITNEKHRNARERLLTSDELRHVRRNGVLVGSHSVTHRPLTQINIDEAFAELSESRKVLQDILGEKIDLFALPY